MILAVNGVVVFPPAVGADVDAPEAPPEPPAPIVIL
jgi:hypothetical protein